MQLEFAAAVDPIFQAALTLIERVEGNVDCEPDKEHALILGYIDQADTLLGDSKQWQLARYAIAVWIDEMLLTTPWCGAAWWRDHILEMELFHSRICSIRFFELAKEASGLSNRDALEVFYNCVVLGFRGMYADKNPDAVAALGRAWPNTIEQWLDRTLRMVEVTPRVQHTDSMHRIIEGAPPLHGRTHTVWWSVAALVMLLANCALFQLLQ